MSSLRSRGLAAGGSVQAFQEFWNDERGWARLRDAVTTRLVIELEHRVHDAGMRHVRDLLQHKLGERII